MAVQTNQPLPPSRPSMQPLMNFQGSDFRKILSPKTWDLVSVASIGKLCNDDPNKIMDEFHKEMYSDYTVTTAMWTPKIKRRKFIVYIRKNTVTPDPNVELDDHKKVNNKYAETYLIVNFNIRFMNPVRLEDNLGFRNVYMKDGKIRHHLGLFDDKDTYEHRTVFIYKFGYNGKLETIIFPKSCLYFGGSFPDIHDKKDHISIHMELSNFEEIGHFNYCLNKLANLAEYGILDKLSIEDIPPIDTHKHCKDIFWERFGIDNLLTVVKKQDYNTV